MNKTPIFHYRLTRAKGNSDKYGPCEVCKEHASEVWIQSESIEYHNLSGERKKTQLGCQTLFGHKACLESQQKLAVASNFNQITK